MASLTDLYKECQAVVSTLILQLGKVKFNRSLCSLLTNKYVASLTYLDNYIFREDGSIDLPCKTALVELRRIMSCGERLVTQWTRKDWWMSVITSSDSASLDKKVILHLREFLACVNVLVQMKTNIMYPPDLVSLESAVKDASRSDIDSLIRSMKEYKRSIFSPSKFAKLAKHLSEKLEAEISNRQHPYTIDIPFHVEICYKDCLGDGSFGAVYKCTFLGVMAAAKVWKTNCMNKEAAEKEASLFSKLRHPNVVQFIGYGVKESQPVIVSELMSTDLRRYLDEMKKKNAGEGPPLPLLVAMNVLVQIAEAMNYLHENGVMHRDLKANNVLINVLEGPDGQLSSSSVQVKLTDFGQSKLKLHDSRYTTPMVGATRWRAPEVFEVEENREKYTKSADVYSFSMLCFEVLTGDVPFKDKPLVTLLESIHDGVRPQLPDVDYCPDYLSALIEKCWATNAVERPQFPLILQLLMDYKARVLKHPYGHKGVPPDYSQNLQVVDTADTDYTTYILEDDNNHHVREPATSLLQEMQSLSVYQPYFKFSIKKLKAATASFSPRNSEPNASQEGSAASPHGSVSRFSANHGLQPNALGALTFTMAELSRVTANFSESHKIGQGSFASVFKGKLRNGQLVAIKRAKKELFETRVSTEFENVVNMLSQVEHLNLVKLIGYLEEGDERILVTEFVTNGNLWQHLDGSPYGVILNMGTRLDIAIDIAHALTYLHYYTDRPIIHRDVKSSNILLTDSYRAKVADFGVADFGFSCAKVADFGFSCVDPSGEMGATHVSTQVTGTPGYVDPEYLLTYQLNVKSDVYSFGILLIELFTGRRPLELSRPSDERVTVRWAFAKFLDGKLRHILDPNIKRTPAIIGILPSLFQLAFSCGAPSKTDRPNMIEVQEKLWDIRKDYLAAWNHQRENQVERNDHAYSLDSVKSPRSGETVKADSAKPRRSEDNESSRARSSRGSEPETPKNRRNIGSPEAADLYSPCNYTPSDALHDRHP